MSHSYESDLRSENSHNGGGNREAREQITATGRDTSKFSFAGLHVQQESVWFLLWRLEARKKISCSLGGGWQCPTCKLRRALELSPRPGLETWEAPLLLGIRRATGFHFFLSPWISSVSMLWLAQHEGTAPRETFWAAEHAIPFTWRGGNQDENLCPSLFSVNSVDQPL